MDPKPKRQKLSQPPVDNEKSNFLSLNDDCIYKVFEWLDLDDICSISETCKRLQLLASDYFVRKHTDKLLHGMCITAVNGKIQLQPNENYMWSFSRCFDTVVLNVKSRNPRDINAIRVDLSSFAGKYCSKYLSSIVFERMLLHRSIGDSITNVLQNIETVVFSVCVLEGDYHQILKYCPNLTYLTVEENYGHKIEKLLLETYPKLEHFNCLYYGRVLLTNNLKQFLRQHPHLKRLTWCFHARILETTFTDKTLECINMIVKNGKKLHELFLSFDGSYDLETICGKLNVLGDRKHFKRLEFDIRCTSIEFSVSKMMSEQGHHLTILKSLVGLHLCNFSRYGSSFLPTLSTMANLRVLQLDYVASMKRSLLSSTPLNGLSCLEELHILTLIDFSVAQEFICRVKSLKIVSVFRCELNISRLDLPMLNVERKKLDCDSKVVVYLNADNKKRNSDESAEDYVVKIKFVNFESNHGNFDNPFIRNKILKK